MAEKTDHSPSSRRGQRREAPAAAQTGTPLGGAHLVWIYALILAGIVVLLYYLLR